MKCLRILSFILLVHHGIVTGQSFAVNNCALVYNTVDQYSAKMFADPETEHKRKHCTGRAIGTGTIIAGAAGIAATAAVIMVDEIGTGAHPHVFSTADVNTAAGAIIGGIGLIMLGDYVCHLSKKYERNHPERFSLMSDGHRVGLAYHF